MREWFQDHVSMAWFQAALFLAAGIVMIYVTYALRSFLPVHSHPWARRLGWRRAFIFLLVPLVPAWNTSLGFMLLPTVLGLAAFNVERLWILKALGSDGYLALLQTAAAGSTLRFAIACNVIAGALVAAGAAALWLVTSGPESDWAWWFAAGLGLNALMNAYDRSRAASRIFSSRAASQAT